MPARTDIPAPTPKGRLALGRGILRRRKNAQCRTDTRDQQSGPAIPGIAYTDDGNDAFAAAPAQIDNGDEALYADKSGTYTKGVLQSGIGLVDLAAYHSFKDALSSGDPADFEKIVLGGPRTLNGPQAGLAFYLDCLDGSQFAVPPAPALASEAYATELVELYWASLLRDVAFTNYPTNAVATQAAAEMSSLPAYAGPRNVTNQVTPEPVVSWRLSCGARRLGLTSRSFCSSRQRWDRCRSPSNISPTKRVPTS